MAVIGNNIPQGMEKVTIDGEKVREALNLYSFQNQIALDIKEPTTPSGYTYQGKLYDGSKLYMKTTLTTVTDGSSRSSAGCTGRVLLIKPNGTQLSVAIPTYTIPSRSETGSSPDSYEYSCKLYLSPDGNVYLRLQRTFKDIRGSNTTDHHTYYQSIYKLNIQYSYLSWTNKVIEVTLGPSMGDGSDYIIENNYIYVVGYNRYNSSSVRYIYGYKYGDTSYKFQQISTNGAHQGDIRTYSTIFARKNKNTYIYFFGPQDYTPGNKWISVTRNSDGTYTESTGTAASLGTQGEWKSFTLYEKKQTNGTEEEFYVWMLGGSGKNEGYHIYKFNSDNSAWEVVYNIENATSYNTKLTTYLNNAPDTVFQGGSSCSIRNDGTFDLIEFSPESLSQGSLSYSYIPTPTVITSMRDFETWYYYSYKYNNIGQKIFFFRVETHCEGDLYYDIRYKCVLEAIDGSPVLYSTFRESDVIEPLMV